MSAPVPDTPDPLHLADYVPGATVALTEAERRPTLSPAGRARLETLLNDPLAPAWTHTVGDRLTAAAVTRSAEKLPTDGWLAEHLATVRDLPAYRGHPGPLVELADFPLIDRAHLMEDIAGFVPRTADLDQLVHGSSSGSTGRALQIPDHLEDVARTLTLLRDLIASSGVDWHPDPARMGLAYVVHQRQAFTYAATLSAFGEATMARINLDQLPGTGSAWPERDAFLARHDPQVITGDPIALADLLDDRLAATLHPLALVSGAAELTPALRRDLAAAYDCPVLDLYGLHETRPVAVSADGGPHVVLDRRVLVEILDPAGDPVAAGGRGEIVVTAGENPLLPLARYRTGDFGRLVDVGGRPANRRPRRTGDGRLRRVRRSPRTERRPDPAAAGRRCARLAGRAARGRPRRCVHCARRRAPGRDRAGRPARPGRRPDGPRPTQRPRRGQAATVRPTGSALKKAMRPGTRVEP